MERKEFIQKIGKGIAAYSVLPIGTNLPIPENAFNKK